MRSTDPCVKTFHPLMVKGPQTSCWLLALSLESSTKLGEMKLTSLSDFISDRRANRFWSRPACRMNSWIVRGGFPYGFTLLYQSNQLLLNYQHELFWRYLRNANLAAKTRDRQCSTRLLAFLDFDTLILQTLLAAFLTTHPSFSSVDWSCCAPFDWLVGSGFSN